jgi:hypothetical protein
MKANYVGVSQIPVIYFASFIQRVETLANKATKKSVCGGGGTKII